MSFMNFIYDLKLKKFMWKIRVKVIRFWKYYSVVVGEIMEMVFVDVKVSYFYYVFYNIFNV